MECHRLGGRNVGELILSFQLTFALCASSQSQSLHETSSTCTYFPSLTCEIRSRWNSCKCMSFDDIHTYHMGPFSTVSFMFTFDRGRSSMQTCTHTQKHACKRRNNAKTPDLRGADRHHGSMPTIVGARPNPREDRHVRVAAHSTRPSERITAKKQASFADDALSRARTFERSPYASFPLPVCHKVLCRATFFTSRYDTYPENY